jgi:hypothetical protein
MRLTDLMRYCHADGFLAPTRFLLGPSIYASWSGRWRPAK